MNAADLQQAVDLDSMTADDLAELVTDYPVRLVISDADGIHTVEYDTHDDQLTFYAYGSSGYDAEETEAVLNLIAENSDVGLALEDDPERSEAVDVTGGTA